MTGLAIQDACTVEKKKADSRILLEGIRELGLEYCLLSPLQWTNFSVETSHPILARVDNHWRDVDGGSLSFPPSTP